MVAKRKKDAPRFAAKAARHELSSDELLDMCVDAAEQRQKRNGFTEAMEILQIALPKAFAQSDGPTEAEMRTYIVDDIYGPMLDDSEFTEPAFERVKQEIFSQGGFLDTVDETVAYCVFAVRAYFAGNETLSWSYACDARHWGAVATMLAKRGEMPTPGALLARIRHQKTYQEQEKVADYWRANIDPMLSAQKSADIILQADISPFSHKKIAEIVSALRKAEPVRKK